MSIEDFERNFFQEFETDRGYLRAHYPRFLDTYHRFREHKTESGLRVLDVGAHWLHQSLIWRRDGHNVIAADVPATLALPNVINLAARNDISLIAYDRLDTGNALDSVVSDSIDVVLFTEILEHITFNPVAFWAEIHRVMSPKGRIVVTTPNYYWARGRAWNIGRMLGRQGGGLTVGEILRTPTYGPHWKEYALREIVEYFTALSRDFTVARAEYVPDPRGLPVPKTILARTSNFIESAHRVFSWGLHVEVELCEKTRGIEIKPSW
jgi:2-polyprenyl-3-methyl-5-hydroxy-6-metoxy-1,4-benzoquinol methylase